MRVAITGHRSLPEQTARLVDKAIRDEIARYPARELVGVSCLADGADQIFARAVLDAGGQLDVIVPAAEYRDGLPAQARDDYDALLARAAHVRRLERRASNPEAHMAASNFMLDRVDRVIAVWDGEPSRAYGGTADVVVVAQQRGLPVTVVWPDGASRDAGAAASTTGERSPD